MEPNEYVINQRPISPTLDHLLNYVSGQQQYQQQQEEENATNQKKQKYFKKGVAQSSVHKMFEDFVSLNEERLWKCQDEKKMLRSISICRGTALRNLPGGKQKFRRLEVKCQFDNCVVKGRRETSGKLVRPQNRKSIGPISYLFRWYSQRHNEHKENFHNFQDIPSLPQMDPLDSNLLLHARYGLNMEIDPVLNLRELFVILEDFEIIPDLIGREDVRYIFQLSQLSHKNYTSQYDDKKRKECSSLRPANPHPEDICFMQFCDCLIRIAIVAFSGDEKFGTVQEKINGLMVQMNLNSVDLRHLKNRLDALERVSMDRGLRHKALRWKYVSSKSQLNYTNVADCCYPWKITSPEKPPKKLFNQILRFDTENDNKKLACWVQYDACMLDMGLMEIGQPRLFRIVLRNRSVQKLGVEVECGLPFLQCFYSEKPLVYGDPRVIEIVAVPNQLGEFLGEIIIVAKVLKKEQMYQQSIFENDGGHQDEQCVVPIYASVVQKI